MSRRENPFQAEREAYQQIEIPDELQYVVKKSIKKAEKLRLEKRKRLIIRSIASVAALFFLTLTIGVNSSYAVSKKVSKMPVVRSVAKVLTVRKYTAEKAADPELQQELAEAQENSEIPVDGLMIEAIPEETVEVQPEQPEVADVPKTEEEAEAVILEGYEKWAKELTIEKLDLITELYEVPVAEEEEAETKVTAQEDSAKKEDVTKETSAKEGTAEKKETVAKEAVSGNDKAAQETPQDAKKEQTTDASKEGQEVSKEAEEDKKLDTILLAELPKEEIRLYGYHENGVVRGVALRIKDRFTCFDWTYLDNRGILPELSYGDANEDGEKEILVFLYNNQNDAQEEKTDSDFASEDSEKTVKNAEEDATADSKASNVATKTETEVVKPESGKTAADANKATSTTDTQKTEADGKSSDSSKTADSSKSTDSSKIADSSKSSDTAKASETNKESSTDNKVKEVTDKTISESEKTSDEEAVSANDQEKESEEKKSLKDVSEIWMICVTEEEMKPQLVSLEEKESPILAFIKSLFE